MRIETNGRKFGKIERMKLEAYKACKKHFQTKDTPFRMLLLRANGDKVECTVTSLKDLGLLMQQTQYQLPGAVS